MRAAAEKPYHLCFETLANQLRLQILEILSRRPMNVTELARTIKAERSRVSHSLEMLRLCSYVDTKKHGKETIYSIRDNTPLTTQQSGTSVFSIIDNHIDQHCKNCQKIERADKVEKVGITG